MILKIVNSLIKVFDHMEEPPEETEGEALRNERFNFQIAVYNAAVEVSRIRLKIEGIDATAMSVRIVENVPGRFTRFPDGDDNVIFRRDDSRLYPDILIPFEEGDWVLRPNAWSAAWVTIKCGNIPAGIHKIKVTAETQTGENYAAEYTLNVKDIRLPESDFIYTNWVHYDGIASRYGVEPFDNEFYQVFHSFLKTAVDHGMNMLYTPLFTPPLDTAVGHERLTVQLVDVIEKADSYSFDWSKLDRFIDFALEHGIRYFEMNHLATQWGAHFCPKITAVNQSGQTEKIFGWDISSSDEKYLKFLSVFLPELNIYLRKKGIWERCYFHISDEPSKSDQEDYWKVYRHIKSILSDCRIIDAVSDVGLDVFEVPVIATCHIADKPQANAWAYYCCTSYKDNLSNRLFNMPSLRNRVLGMQLYLSGVKGFLHWGYNFYNTALSYHAIDPFLITDAGGSFPAGDSFIVYPGKDGALDSLRLEVFYEGLQDYRALCLLESYSGREYTERLLSEAGIIGWREYPHDEKMFLAVRKKINEAIILYGSKASVG